MIEEEARRRGALLRAARQAAGISAEEFADGLEISRSHLVNLEVGRRYLRTELAEQAATILGTTAQQLLTDPPTHHADGFGPLPK